jgi:hypothetical protein
MIFSENRFPLFRIMCTFEQFPGTNAAVRSPMVGAGSKRGKSVVSKRYLVRQASALIAFSRSTNNPELAAVLAGRAADLQVRIDEKVLPVDPSPYAPDVEPSPN